MKLILNDNEYMSVLGTFTGMVQDATEQQIELRQLRKELAEVKGKLSQSKKRLMNVQEDYRYLEQEVKNLRTSKNDLTLELNKAKNGTNLKEALFKVLEPLVQGRKIETIKVMRELTHMSLADCKALVETGKLPDSEVQSSFWEPQKADYLY